MSVTSMHYGYTQDGRAVNRHILENDSGMRVAVIDYGCIVTNIWVRDKNGAERDLVLGYDSLSAYERGSSFFGAFVGRYANRIENSEFTIDGVTYRLDPNEGKNHLHGSFARKVFETEVENDSLVMRVTSPEGDDGFPGNMNVTVTYTLTNENALVMDYTAVTDAPTIINLTNHSYFNLDGQETGPVLRQSLQINAEEYTESNEETCPTGRILPVAGTPLDFRKEKEIGAEIDADWPGVKMYGGYDHNYILNKAPGMLGLAAVARGAESGIVMETYTTQPAVQFYSGNGTGNSDVAGKGGFKYPAKAGFCLETQHYPCTPSHANFPSVELRPDEEFHETTIYKFRTE